MYVYIYITQITCEEGNDAYVCMYVKNEAFLQQEIGMADGEGRSKTDQYGDHRVRWIVMHTQPRVGARIAGLFDSDRKI